MDLEEFEVEPEAIGEDVPGYRLHSSEFDDVDEPAEGQPAPAPSPASEAQPQYLIPEVIKSFILYFHRHLKEQSVYEIHSIYENSFNKLTEKYFKQTPWPPAEAVAPLVENDKIFLMLYKEMYYRHIYSKLSPSIAQRAESWQNYCDLFDMLLAADVHLELDLPSQWLWDIVDEFIYQFGSYCQFAAKLRNKGDEEFAKLKAQPKVWNATDVLTYLNRLIEKSQILRYLERERTGQEHSADDFSSHPVFRLLGYFCIVGMLRVQCLLGNYWLALKMLDPIDLSKKGLYSRVTSCQITLYYYMGFAYLMLRRYVDAIKSFTAILLYISRTKQYHTRSYQYEMIIKKNEQMYALLAIAVSLCPQRIDENLHSVLKDKFSDKMARMQRSEAAVSSDIEELFSYACPKFISPCPLVDGTQPLEPYNHQKAQFMNEVALQLNAQLPTIRSYLKLYTTIPVSKLANFLEVPEAAFVANLLCFKHKTRSRVWTGSGPLLSGRLASSSDVDFYIDKDMIHIADSKATRRYGDFFIRHIVKFSDLLRNLEQSRIEGATA